MAERSRLRDRRESDAPRGPRWTENSTWQQARRLVQAPCCVVAAVKVLLLDDVLHLPGLKRTMKQDVHVHACATVSA